MKKLATLLLLATLVGCGKSYESQIDTEAAKPAASDKESAKAAHEKATKFVDYLKANPDKASPEALKKAKNLQNKRRTELEAFSPSNKLGSALSTLVEGAKNLDPSTIIDGADKVLDWGLGVAEIKKKPWVCPSPDTVDPTAKKKDPCWK